jgi:hypothetical protein
MHWAAVMTLAALFCACRGREEPMTCGNIVVTFKTPTDGEVTARTVDVTVEATRDGMPLDLDSATLSTRLINGGGFSAPRPGALSGSRASFAGVTLEAGQNLLKATIQTPGMSGQPPCAGTSAISVEVSDTVCGQGSCDHRSCDVVACGPNQQCARGVCFTLGLPTSCDAGGCDCTAGSERACYPYGAGLADPTVGMGICKPGTSLCASQDGGATFWTDCVGAVVPRTEQCNGFDDDCDGVVDRGCPTGFGFSDGPMSRLFGLSDGGNPFTLACPLGQVLYGLDIITSAGFGVYSLSLRCATLHAETADGGTAITRAPASTLGPIGWTMPPNAKQVDFECLHGVITGVFGREADQLGDFGVTCGVLSTHGAPGAISLSMVDGGASTPQGTASYSTPFSFTCPSPQLATGFFGFSGAAVDKLGVQCAAPKPLLKP